MRMPIIGGRRPVLFDRRVWRHSQPISFAAIEGITVMVSDRDHVHLSGAEDFYADVRIALAEPAGVDGVSVWIRKPVPLRFDEFRRRRQRPTAALPERWKTGVVFGFQPHVRLACGLVE